jgi:hypothetical protein
MLAHRIWCLLVVVDNTAGPWAKLLEPGAATISNFTRIGQNKSGINRPGQVTVCKEWGICVWFYLAREYYYLPDLYDTISCGSRILDSDKFKSSLPSSFAIRWSGMRGVGEKRSSAERNTRLPSR